MTSTNDIRVEREPPITTVTLDRPDKRNAVTSAMWVALPEIVAGIRRDPATKVALLTGAGDVAFSAGADIAEMRSNFENPERMRVMQHAVQVAQEEWAQLPIPTIAVIRGACAGGGCGLALACDLRIAAADAFFSVPPARLGICYSLADSRRLVDLVGPSRAKDILFTGRRVDSAEALAMGLVNEIVPAAELLQRAHEIAACIAGNAGNSVRAAKKVVNAIMDGVRAETPETRRLYDESFASPEFTEAAHAFVEKRPPRF
ncbi:MAG: enoyl-CoA hydratase-related protein [Steroidobacteraceae bacterium]